MVLAFAILVATMVAGGLLGGWASFLVGDLATAPKDDAGDDDAPAAAPSLKRSLVTGVAAALVVPVFLQLAAVGTDGGLVADFLTHFGDETEPQKAFGALLIVLGFCVAAGFGARAFLSSISERMIRQASERAEKAVQATRTLEAEVDHARAIAAGLQQVSELQARTLDALEAGQTADPTAIEEDADPAEPPDEGPPEPAPAPAAPAPLPGRSPAPAADAHGAGRSELTEQERKILNALAEKPSVRRSIKGIRDDAPGVGDPASVRGRLNDLHGRGLVRRLAPINQASQLPRWKLTAAGWAAIARAN